MSFTCRAYGLTLRSDMPLQGPQPVEADAADVIIAEGGVPEELDHIETATQHWSANAMELLLHVPRVGRFYAANGNTIRYQPLLGVDAATTSGFILGSSLGALLHQRRQLVLHAAVIEREGKAFAICGKSGAGKSTTAGWLLEAGARLLSDDLCVLADQPAPLVLPGYPQAKLTRSALAELGHDPAGLRMLPDEREKFAVPRTDNFLDQPLPLAGVFVLERVVFDESTISLLRPPQAIVALVKHTYRRHYVVASRATQHYAALDRLVAQVPVWNVRRPAEGHSTQFVVSAISDAIAQTVAN